MGQQRHGLLRAGLFHAQAAQNDLSDLFRIFGNLRHGDQTLQYFPSGFAT
jgi:hypothetical protein